MAKEKASAGLFDQLSKAVESGEGDEIVGKLKVRMVSLIFWYCNVSSQCDGCQRQSQGHRRMNINVDASGCLLMSIWIPCHTLADAAL